MEISQSQIARLVLGYLRSEKCNAASKEFLRSSPHLKDVSTLLKKNKYFVTRVNGLSLIDIINEYAQIYSLIDARLEACEDPSEPPYRGTLTEKLNYLIDNAKDITFHTPSISSRCSTPFMNKEKELESFTAEEISHEDLNTTPLENLPGYSREANFTKKSKKHIGLDAEEDYSFEVLTRSLLENHELHEKIAENINSVRNSTGESTTVTEQFSNVAVQELESTIKTIVEKTEKDPIFDKLLTEIIGGDVQKNSVNVQENKHVSDLRTPQKHSEIRTTNDDDSHIKSRLRSTKKNTDLKINDHNIDAVESIVAFSRSSDNNKDKQLSVGSINCDRSKNVNCPTEEKQQRSVAFIEQQIVPVGQPIDTCKKNDVSQTLNINTGNGEVIFFEGTFDSFVKSSNQTNSNSSPVILNQNGLLMLQQNASTNVNSNIESTCEKPLVIWNNTQLLSNQPQNKIQNILTEQDIMTMPTVIVCDENQKLIPTQTVAISCTQQPKPKPKYVKIAPAKTVKSQNEVSYSKNNDVPSSKIISQYSVDIIKPTNEGVQSDKTPKSKSPPKKTPDSKLTIKKSTPKSGSHVRQLDFNLSPPKDRQSLNVSKRLEVKSTESSKKANRCWDADLRALISSKEEMPQSAKKKKKTRYSKSKNNLDTSNTERDARLIENALLDSSLNKSSSKLNSSSETEQLHQKKKIKVTSKIQPGNEEAEVFLHISEPPTNKKDTLIDSNEIILTENLINCNGKPRYRKKCNIENVRKEVKVTKVKEVKAVDITSDSSNKLILSPSKLNASKRSLLDTDSNQIQNLNHVSPNKEGKFITPETLPKPMANHSHKIINKYNLTPMLETPMKLDQFCPKTPGLVSPINTTDTPFTKVFKEHLQGVDLSSIPTPRFPLTPNFPITPMQNESPYPSRGTDYSTSSSYYQPSDNEQSKSLEQLINDECNKQETKNSQQKVSKDKKSETVPTDNCQISQPNKEHEQEIINHAIVEKMKSLKNNIIGKKNLQLVKEIHDGSISYSSNSDSSSSSINENSDSSNCSWASRTGNDTIIQNENFEKTINSYSLRSKGNILEKEIAKQSFVENIKNIISNVEVKSSLMLDNQIETYQEKVLTEMEEKKKRTIDKFKTEKENKTSKDHFKKTNKNNLSNKNVELSNKIKKKVRVMPRRNAKIVKRKKIPEITINKGSPIKKSRSCSSLKSPTQENEVSSEKSTCLVSHKSHENTKEENQSSENNETNVKSLDKSNESDEEAQNLVKGLQLRGIHLVHNKSPKVKSDASTNKDIRKSNDLTHESPSKDQLQSEKINKTLENKGVKGKDEKLIKPQTLPKPTQFQNKSFPQENFSFVYNESESKNQSSYNLDILSKRTVYSLETHNGISIKRTMTCSPFEMLLDIPSTETHKKDSPLENLYAKLPVSNQSRTKKIETIKGKDSSTVSNKNRKKSTEEKTKLSNKSENKIENSDSKKNEVENDESIQENNDSENIKEDDNEDDLMNFVLTGTDEVSRKDENRPLKRKNSISEVNEEIDKPNSKRAKNYNCEELIKKIDVDSFLKRLHGK